MANSTHAASSKMGKESLQVQYRTILRRVLLWHLTDKLYARSNSHNGCWTVWITLQSSNLRLNPNISFWIYERWYPEASKEPLTWRHEDILCRHGIVETLIVIPISFPIYIISNNEFFSPWWAGIAPFVHFYYPNFTSIFEFFESFRIPASCQFPSAISAKIDSFWSLPILLTLIGISIVATTSPTIGFWAAWSSSTLLAIASVKAKRKKLKPRIIILHTSSPDFVLKQL